MKRLISSAVMVAALGSLAPIAAMAAAGSPPASAATTVLAPGSSFEFVDKATGEVLGQLISVGGNRNVITVLAEEARTQPAVGPDRMVNAQPKTTQDWEQFWRRVLPPPVSG